MLNKKSMFLLPVIFFTLNAAANRPQIRSISTLAYDDSHVSVSSMSSQNKISKWAWCLGYLCCGRKKTVINQSFDNSLKARSACLSVDDNDQELIYHAMKRPRVENVLDVIPDEVVISEKYVSTPYANTYSVINPQRHEDSICVRHAQSLTTIKEEDIREEDNGKF